MNDIATAVQAAPADGERADFDQMYARWYESVVRLCRRTLGGHGDAEALAQEVFVRAWASWGSYDPSRPFGPWISTIARRLCINEIATGRRREARAADVSMPSVVASGPAEEQFERVAQSDLVARVLGRIPVRHRRLLFLSDVEGWSTDEIARFEGVTPTAVRVTLCRARRSFRRWWEHDVRTGAAGAFGLLHRLRGWLDLVGVRRQEWAVGVVALFAAGSGVGGPPASPMATATATAAAVAPVSPAPEGLASTVAGARHAVGSTARAESAAAAAAPPVGAPVIVPEDAVDPAIGADYRFTPSPSYDEDQTVFAAGYRRCDQPGEVNCPLLLKSTDGGRTWSQLPAVGYRGGQVLLAPTYPRDPRLFARGLDGLSVSHDGGGRFELLAALPPSAGGRQDVAVSPRFSEGDARILLGATVVVNSAVGGLEYREADGSLVPIDLPLPSGATPVRFAVSPRYAEDRTMLVSVLETPRGSALADDPTVALLRPVAGVYRCTDIGCEASLQVPYGNPVPVVTWSKGPRPVAIAVSGFDAYRSGDGGRTFMRTAVPHGPNILTVTSDREGRLYLGLFDAQAAAVLDSDDDGSTWREVWRTPGVLGLLDMLALDDGTILGSKADMDGGGIVRSRDGGRTWGD